MKFVEMKILKSSIRTSINLMNHGSDKDIVFMMKITSIDGESDIEKVIVTK